MGVGGWQGRGGVSDIEGGKGEDKGNLGGEVMKGKRGRGGIKGDGEREAAMTAQKRGGNRD